MRVEHGPMRRLEQLAPGTRVQLAPDRVGTLLEVTFTRAIVELDRGEDRRREIAPACEVEVLTTEVLATGPGMALPAAEMRNADRGQPGSPTRLRCTSECPPARAGRSVCAGCARPADRRRPSRRYCSDACRQRAYRQRQETRAQATTSGAEEP
jgi:hypothetical protein